MLKKVLIDGKYIKQEFNGETINEKSVEVTFEEGPSIIWEDTLKLLNELPKDRYGVYTIFANDRCIYVGKTWEENGFKGRISRHEKLPIFMRRADYIKLFYIEKEATNEILLFERIKISQLEPTLNRDDLEARQKSDIIQEETFEQYNLYLSLVLKDQKFMQEVENMGVTEEELQSLFETKFNIIRRSLDIDSLVLDNTQFPETVPLEYYCFKCKDTGKTEDSKHSKDYDCYCWIGKNKFFDLNGYEQGD